VTRIAVVDYGMGNLRSVSKALEHVAPAAEVRVTADPAEVRAADRVVFPGQGAMPDCMRELEASGLRGAVEEAARAKPFLGICIGLQMLFERSEEGDVPGLGILPGHVRRFPADLMRDASGARLKVPHMGWNEVEPTGDHYYFVHSFYVEPARMEDVMWISRYGGIRFPAAVRRGNVMGCQFHPEKSQRAGFALLRNFLSF
jgi:glutamine amidotransferase